jgi:tetratricopeptide (TPR) repeat protein
MGDDDRAVIELVAARVISGLLEEPVNEGIALAALGEIFTRKRAFEQAIKAGQESVQRIAQAGDRRLECEALLGFVHTLRQAVIAGAAQLGQLIRSTRRAADLLTSMGLHREAAECLSETNRVVNEFRGR